MTSKAQKTQKPVIEEAISPARADLQLAWMVKVVAWHKANKAKAGAA